MRADDIAVLLDYCEGKGKFSEIDTYIGMEGSNGTMLLPDYILKLDSERQQELLDSLVEGAVGRIPELERYVALLAHALMMSTVLRRCALSASAKKTLEEEFASDEHVQGWLQALDQEPLPNGVEFKKTWHFALMLGTILHAIGSTAERRTTLLLREHAVAEQLRERLASLSQ